MATPTVPTIQTPGISLQTNSSTASTGTPTINFNLPSSSSVPNLTSGLTSGLNTKPSSGIVSSQQSVLNTNATKGVAAATSSLTGVGGNNQPMTPDQMSAAGYKFNIYTGESLQGGSSSGGSSTSSSGSSTGGNSGGGKSGNSGGPTDYASWYANTIQNIANAGIDTISNTYKTALSNTQLAGQQIQLQFDTNLASLNSQYSTAYSQLQQQHQNDVGSAIAQAATLDPFGVNMSGADRAYTSKIDLMYQQQATYLTNAYNAQQVALQNGQAEAALGIQQQINQATDQFHQSIFNLTSSTQQSLGQAMQFQQSKQVQYLGQFRSLLSNLILNPSDVKGMSDQQIAATPWGQAGLSAGLTAEQIRNEASQPTSAEVTASQKNVELRLRQDQIYNEDKRINLQNITTGIAASKFATDKSTQYSTYQNAIQGFNDLKSTLYGSGAQDLVDTINSFLKNTTDTNYGKVSAMLGPGFMSIYKTLYNKDPSAADLSSFLGAASKSSDVRGALLNMIAPQLQNTIGTAIATDSGNTLINQDTLSKLKTALPSLLSPQPGTGDLPSFLSAGTQSQ